MSFNVKLLKSKAYKLLIVVLWNSSQIKEKNWEIIFSGDTLNSTIYSIGIILIILATLQIFANAVLLMGALMENERWVPSMITTRVCYLSTFWGTIDAYRVSLRNESEEDSHFLIDWSQAARLRSSKFLCLPKANRRLLLLFRSKPFHASKIRWNIIGLINSNHSRQTLLSCNH